MKTRPIIYQILTRLFGNTQSKGKLWGSITENGIGKLNDITDKALSEIRSMGVTHVWYTGVIAHATQTDHSTHGIAKDHPSIVKGRAGSAYAIKDYYDIDPDLAEAVPDRMKEFKALVTRTHQQKLKVIIDFVPNHVARQYRSVARPFGTADLGEKDDPDKAFDPQNNFYYLPGTTFQVPHQTPMGHMKVDHYTESPAKASGNDVFNASPSANDWFETIKINYGVDYQNQKQYFDPIPDTWFKMKDILLFWAAKKVDGFRCDMAEMVPVEFWSWVIPAIREKYPKILFIAEVYNPAEYHVYIRQGKFDYLYDKVELYDTLKRIIRDEAPADMLTRVWQKQEGIGDNMLRFLENHDEQRLASACFSGDMKKGIPMMAAAALMHKGPVMMYFGQEVGEPAEGASGYSGNDCRTTIFDYWYVPEHQKWMNKGAFDGGKLTKAQKQLRDQYIQILRLCNQSPELREGDFYDLQYFNRNEVFTGYSDKIYSFIRHTQTSAVLVIINFSGLEEKAILKIPVEALERFGQGNKATLSIQSHNHFKVGTKSLTDYMWKSEWEVNLSPFSYQLFQIG